MPIRPENRRRYPQNWKSISYKIMQRAGNRCEVCGVRHGDWGWRDERGRFQRVRARPFIEAGHGKPPFYTNMRWPDGVVREVKIIKIILTVAHLDHQPENCADENLMAMCQRCHNLYDINFRAFNRHRCHGTAPLFGELPIQVKDPNKLFELLRANQEGIPCT
ncbi:MAG: hypothetical protein DCC73_11820 [Proteobacteria bacterium]|nr:MAG: hypothetical protein DCC73_11820 [Pseudomonadota bacterium]